MRVCRFLSSSDVGIKDVRQFNLDYSLNPDIPSEITFLTMTIIFNKIRIKKNIYSS